MRTSPYQPEYDQPHPDEAQDKTLVCIEPDCGRDFIFTAGEQMFYVEKGLAHEPKRCKSCRQRRREQRES